MRALTRTSLLVLDARRGVRQYEVGPVDGRAVPDLVGQRLAGGRDEVDTLPGLAAGRPALQALGVIGDDEEIERPFELGLDAGAGGHRLAAGKAQCIFGPEPRALEHELDVAGAGQAHHLLVAADGEARHPLVDEEERHVTRLRAGVGDRGHDEEVGEEAEVHAEGYSSLLDLKNPLPAKQTFVRVDEPEEDHAIEPVFPASRHGKQARGLVEHQQMIAQLGAIVMARGQHQVDPHSQRGAMRRCDTQAGVDLLAQTAMVALQLLQAEPPVAVVESGNEAGRP